MYKAIEFEHFYGELSTDTFDKDLPEKFCPKDYKLVIIRQDSTSEFVKYQNYRNSLYNDNISYVAFSYDLASDFKNNLTGYPFSLNTGMIPRNSKIYMNGKCPYPIDDIRKYYTIKRKQDDADCVVISPFKPTTNGVILYMFPVVCEKQKIIFGFEYTNIYDKSHFNTSRYNLIRQFYNVDRDDLIFSKGYCTESADILTEGLNKDIFNVLFNRYTKPVYTYTSLDVNSAEELTKDTIMLVYNTLIGGNIPDMKTQIAMLGQYNFRKYKYTLNLLCRMAYKKSGYRRGFQDYVNVPSKYSKAEQNVMNEIYSGYYNATTIENSSSEDLYMAQDIINDMIDVGKCRYTDIDTLMEKIHNIGLDDDDFNKLFNHVVKITPKSFEKDN